MLRIPVRLDLSSIHGLGAFAVEPIAKGTEVWRFTPGLDLDLDPAALEELPEGCRETLFHYGYIDPRLGRYILAIDDARFFNHSDTPNLVVDFSQDPYGVDLAARDIEPGEELTIDYVWVEGHRPGD